MLELELRRMVGERGQGSSYMEPSPLPAQVHARPSQSRGPVANRCVLALGSGRGAAGAGPGLTKAGLFLELWGCCVLEGTLEIQGHPGPWAGTFHHPPDWTWTLPDSQILRPRPRCPHRNNFLPISRSVLPSFRTKPFPRRDVGDPGSPRAVGRDLP